ncbi:MAG: HAD hydrolase-like protein [Candidatus Aenigmarchaeota archaeon]|nr:HAD hydrolase-like protein [Candidatus Aenigmarchaeota archaeon]
MVNLIAFDFHGTLCKGTEEAVLESSNLTLKYFKRNERFTFKDILELFGKPWGDYFRRICPDLKNQDVCKMVEQALSYDNIVVPKHIKPMEGSIETLKKIKKNRDIIIVVSTSQQKDLEAHFYPTIGVSNLIDDTLGIMAEQEKVGNFCAGEEKAKALKNYIKGKKFQKMIIIGDMDTDIKAGKIAGFVTIFFNPDGKINSEADYSVKDLREILKILYE